MKALTVQQPWAWAIVHGGKNVENRTQAWSYRGPLAIHAGARWSQRGEESQLMFEACGTRRPEQWWTAMHTGALIGVADLADVHHYAGSGPDAIACCESRWAEERYDEHGGRTRLDVVHLVLENPRPLEVPIPCPGRLGLWTPPAEILDELQEASA